MKIDFRALSPDLQTEIISTLYFYGSCHIEHANGKDQVCTSYCLKRNYADDEYITDEFTKKDLGIKFDGNRQWEDMTLGWEKMTREEQITLSQAQRIMIKARANADLPLVINHLDFVEDSANW